MPSIQFIVTGKLEFALPKALERFFPTLDFLPPKWSQGFTSVKIDEQIKRKTEHKRDVDKLANALVTTAELRKAADMIIVVDDLEIINLYHPEKVVECFREAVENKMQVHKSTQRVRKCPETDKKTDRKHRYRETKGGVEALKILDWNTVLSSKQNYVKFLRALIHDIAWKFDLPIDDTGQCASFTEYTDKANRVLRNI